jgi:SAM-dependent methyltransferase
VGSEGYLFNNEAPEAAVRFAGLEAGFDEHTAGHLLARGVGPGWRCLEVGAGSGSIARWLAAQVGTGGSVLATDIDPGWLDAGGFPQIEVRRHNVEQDALPDAAFDLIHARLVLVHLPGRDEAIERLAAALKPGGWLVIEDFDSIVSHCLDPHSDAERAFVAVSRAITDSLHERGADTTYARSLPHRLLAAGLVDVGASGQVVFFRGGEAQSQIQRANIEQVGPALVDASRATPEEVATARQVLDDPAFVGNTPLMITAWGQRPT